MATVKAQLNNLRLAPRKVRLITNLTKGKDALKALEQLEFVIRRPALPVSKLLRSAIANAENNFNMVASNLFIKDFQVDEGRKLKRYKPKARGAVGEIQKKTSHLRLILEEKVPGLKAEMPKTKVAKEHDHEHEQPEVKAKIDEPASKKASAGKPEIKTELGKKSETTSTKRRWFQRKSV
ncbi:MAG: 50S ribosomal protein L22 [Candidatus Yanofskybacteria bacterium GW2011_GWA1_48_10]|uniref:Large ribosomal subunit protein uL22 n=2 Tax=Candidatus Yanofskyibacteriota TaxID=1752733 RepID=A0A0G1WI43_9BACT|nr:MAG: 50S ribosomal protein L22 [Candidatus Yanofskybacteria bacterium GW2011_GWA1_48_10]OGN06749.1 MAG: 50S ribosomal protein L22 [Candidatus Yanofskybacteria bacterium RIFCSPHIGHO2_01_FULL_48_25b]